MQEIWKDIPNYEGLYQVSSLGRVKSLSREVCNSSRCYISKELILKSSLSTRGYPQVVIFNKATSKTRSVHQLVAESFLNYKPNRLLRLVVDHKNDIKTDNTLINLQIVTQRYNTCKTQGKYSSKYKGVSWDEKSKKWRAEITIDNNKKYLGLFKCELAASLAYQNKLKEII